MYDVRTFTIPAGDTVAEQALAGFLRSVVQRRIETAFENGMWNVLVFFEDQKHKEEQVQIESAISTSLKMWRRKKAGDMDENLILSDVLIQQIGRFAPTTDVELRTLITSTDPDGVSDEAHYPEIVAEVRNTLDDLRDYSE